MKQIVITIEIDDVPTDDNAPASYLVTVVDAEGNRLCDAVDCTDLSDALRQAREVLKAS